MLMLHNRIDAAKPPSGPSPTAKYNKIVSDYIASIHDSTVLHEPLKLAAIPFYVALLVGEKAQRSAFAKVMVQMKDESIMAAIHSNNKEIFEGEMCKRILNSVPRLAIYQGDARSYDNELWHTLRDDIESKLEEKGDHSVIE